MSFISPVRSAACLAAQSESGKFQWLGGGLGLGELMAHGETWLSLRAEVAVAFLEPSASSAGMLQ